MTKLKSILLIEDDFDDQHFFKQAVDCLHQSVFCKTVRNGQEAIDHLDQIQQYELIFLDLRLPAMTGIELLSELKRNEKLKQIPVVIISASTDPSDKINCEAIGIKNFFKKPVTISELCFFLQNSLKDINNN